MASQPERKTRITLEVDSGHHYKWMFICTSANITKTFADGQIGITAEFGNITDEAIETIEIIDRTNQ